MKSVIAAALCVVVVLIAGCGGGGGSDAGPRIANARAVLPLGFTFTGGAMTILADVTDNGFVGPVRAAISRGSQTLTTLALVHGSQSAYSVTYNAPANSATSAVTYTVVVSAQDTLGNPAAPVTLSFDVPAAPTAPQPPHFP